MVCHTALLDKPTSIASYSRSPDRRVSMHRWAASLLIIWKSQFPILRQALTQYNWRLPRFRHLLTACIVLLALTSLPTAAKLSVIACSTGLRTVSACPTRAQTSKQNSTNKHNVVSTELAYLLGQPCVLVRLLAVRCGVLFWHAHVQSDVPRIGSTKQLHLMRNQAMMPTFSQL
jgi:hypothetical protein